MPNIHIVTDSCAHFVDSRLTQRYPITVVPNKIEIGGKVYLEGVDLTSEEALRLMAGQSTPPVVTSPSEADFVRVYNKIARDYDAIISIHASREIYASWHNARRAAPQLSGNCEVALVDSQSLCVAQGILVGIAAELLGSTESFDSLVRKVRGTVEHLYSVYYVETVNYLLHNRIMSTGHSILSTMLGVKPLLSIEEGRLMPIEKVRTRLQAVERIVEFVTEFDGIREAVILQHKPNITEQTRMLQDRLAVEFTDREFTYSVYNASLAALIGTDASGLVLLEDETGNIAHEFDED
ncbi:MAG: DegV family protein [Anaerolineae bacterium]|nr:DegV family protein [Anaerolineae bacterium]